MTVRVLESKLTLQVRNPDELTTEPEVGSAAQSVLGDAIEVMTKRLILAILSLDDRDAEKLPAKGHIKIGWFSCRIRPIAAAVSTVAVSATSVVDRTTRPDEFCVLS
ncbi:hypothetical protein J6590_073369 [Homalodisca vitripennis]|nr:hypothetical protein J6590_073369 [Homalodisca vitripennis]